MYGKSLGHYPMEMGVSAIAGSKRELTEGTDGLAPVWPADLQQHTLAVVRSVITREGRGTLSPRSAQMILKRLMPPLEPARIVPPINLDDIPTPTTVAHYRKAMRQIYRAAMDGKCSLDEARKAMILTKTLWRTELETAGLDHAQA
jgi:hypothetical protein